MNLAIKIFNNSFFLIFILILSFHSKAYPQQDSIFNDTILQNTPKLTKSQWVDSVFQTLTLDEKIGQLFMIRAHSNLSAKYHNQVKAQVDSFKVGGVCFFQGTPFKQKQLTSVYNSVSKIPLFVAIDGEWGIGMRLDSVIDFPRQMTLGATNDTLLMYEIGKAFGEQCRAVGLNVNFAPVVDVNNNPRNPVINNRSFGENPQRVAQMAWGIANGMQSQGVMACAKHFPGHGDTHSDSHKTLPTVEGNLNLLDSIHLAPFRHLTKRGVHSVMVAHLFIPTYDPTPNLATSLSPKVVNGLLFDSLDFKGLAFTDALEMKGVSSYFEAGEIELKALLAGNDILLLPTDLKKAIETIKMALDSGQLTMEYLDAKVHKILNYKYDIAVNQKDIILKTANLSRKKYQTLINRSYREAITLLLNVDSILPLQQTNPQKIALISIGNETKNKFSQTIAKYADISTFSLPSKASLSQAKDLANLVSHFDKVIINVMGTSHSAYRNYGISQTTVDFVNILCEKTKVILVISANPYSASRFVEQCDPAAVIVAYEDNPIVHQISAESIFGAHEIKGKLPVSVNKKYKEGFGLETKQTILGQVMPEEIGFKSKKLERIDSIINSGIEMGAYPGAQVLIAKNGKIFYKKEFGYFTYDKTQKVTDSTIYDLASITKAMATTLAMMKLVQEGKIDIDLTLGHYLPELQQTNKGTIYIRDLMAHQARLKPWIPFYLDIAPKKTIDTNYLKNSSMIGFSTQVSKNLFIMDSYRDTIIEAIIESELLPKSKYLYSDLGMYFLQRIIEKTTKIPLDKYCDSVFYRPLRLKNTTYNPLNKMTLNNIAPTENDRYFRKELIRGYVHDQGAAMLGGVAGHAGLFSNVEDLAVLCQMLLQNGEYAGRQYLSTEVIEEFTRQQFPLNHNRRGLGFDKPLPMRQTGGPTSILVSGKSFGHSGFTGTYFWVDPKYNLIYIFLSNRVYPDAENRKLITSGIRTQIQEEIYLQMGVTK
ncbi:MAG: serine hydrolase [Bacteroidales bacterium]|nr:serine hydrolase [Bacteroidales bacterium]